LVYSQGQSKVGIIRVYESKKRLWLYIQKDVAEQSIKDRLDMVILSRLDNAV